MALPPTDFHALKTFDESLLEPLHELQVKGEPSFVGGLISDFLKQVTELNEAVQTAQKAADVAALEQAAHKLKSSSAVLGLEKIAGICLSIEDSARKRRPTENQVAALDLATPEAVVVLKSYLSKVNA